MILIHANTFRDRLKKHAVVFAGFCMVSPIGWGRQMWWEFPTLVFGNDRIDVVIIASLQIF